MCVIIGIEVIGLMRSDLTARDLHITGDRQNRQLFSNRLINHRHQYIRIQRSSAAAPVVNTGE
ncbi:hypothetical protein D3C81_1702420 [compost metagenome]